MFDLTIPQNTYYDISVPWVEITYLCFKKKFWVMFVIVPDTTVYTVTFRFRSFLQIVFS